MDISAEAHDFLEKNRDLGQEVLNLQMNMQDRRDKLLDMDITEMVNLRRQTFNELINEVTKCEEASNNLHQAIDYKLVGLIEDEGKELFEPLLNEVKEIIETIEVLTSKMLD